ncbi:MAG: hypothetical protein ACK53Y_11565, partial [bacterium]
MGLGSIGTGLGQDWARSGLGSIGSSLEDHVASSGRHSSRVRIDLHADQSPAAHRPAPGLPEVSRLRQAIAPCRPPAIGSRRFMTGRHAGSRLRERLTGRAAAHR